MESIPEVLEDKESSTEQSDTASVHDIDYVNPRGVRFTQSTQRDGNRRFFFCHLRQLKTFCLFASSYRRLSCLAGGSLIPYGLPCLRELFRFLISLTNPHDRHNTDTMMHMGLQLLTVALESGHISNYQSLLVLVKDELCRHLLQVLQDGRKKAPALFFSEHTSHKIIFKMFLLLWDWFSSRYCLFLAAECRENKPLCLLHKNLLFALWKHEATSEVPTGGKSVVLDGQSDILKF